MDQPSQLSENSTKRCNMYDVVKEHAKQVNIENVQTTIEVSDEVVVVIQDEENEQPVKKRVKSSSIPVKSKKTQQQQQQQQPTELPLNDSPPSSSSSPHIFLHVEHTLPQCTSASSNIIEEVMTTISDAVGMYVYQSRRTAVYPFSFVCMFAYICHNRPRDLIINLSSIIIS